MFEESVHCQISVAQGNRKVVPRTRTGYVNDLSYMYEPYDKIITGNESEHHSLSLRGNR